jgi:predicted metal-dependent hydrolase
MTSLWHDHSVPEFLQVGKEVLPLVIKRHRSAKRICLRYHPGNHAISLTLPRHTRVVEGLNFLTQKSEWLITTLLEMPSKKRIKPGVVIPLLGERVRVKHDKQQRYAYLLKDEVLTISGEREEFTKRMTDALRKVAREEITTRALKMAKKTERRIQRITVRDTRSRWGSCSSTGNLSFSWRLIFAPEEVLEYVVAHEVAHLRYMNHSEKFWNLVSYLCPNYEAAKAWLKLHGKELYRFDA